MIRITEQTNGIQISLMDIWCMHLMWLAFEQSQINLIQCIPDPYILHNAIVYWLWRASSKPSMPYRVPYRIGHQMNAFSAFIYVLNNIIICARNVIQSAMTRLSSIIFHHKYNNQRIFGECRIWIKCNTWKNIGNTNISLKNQIT